MDKISAVINVVEEEVKLLPRTLASLKNFADEIVVIDMTEGGGLKPLARKEGIKVIPHERVSYVELVRNLSLTKATGNWILILDPDEELPLTLAKRLREIADGQHIHPPGAPQALHHPAGEGGLPDSREVDLGGADFYRIPRKNLIFGKWMQHSRWWPDYNIRFFKKGFVSWNEIIHGVPVTQGRGADLPAREDLALLHHHYDTIEQYLARMDRYTSTQAKLILQGDYKFIWMDLIKKPWGEFLSRYFFGEGYKDGLHGLAVALLQSFSELILYLKIWQSEKFLEQGITVGEINREFSSSIRETKWWLVDILIKSKDELSSLPLKIYRKLFLKDL